VINVEQQFLHLYSLIAPHEKNLEPLHFELHQKHFEEEARHAPFPYLLIELMSERTRSPWTKAKGRIALMMAHFLQSAWTVDSLRIAKKNIAGLSHTHRFFADLESALPLLERQSFSRLMWRMFTRSPFVSSLVNPSAHKKVNRFARKNGIFVIPFPEPKKPKLSAG